MNEIEIVLHKGQETLFTNYRIGFNGWYLWQPLPTGPDRMVLLLESEQGENMTMDLNHMRLANFRYEPTRSWRVQSWTINGQALVLEYRTLFWGSQPTQLDPEPADRLAAIERKLDTVLEWIEARRPGAPADAHPIAWHCAEFRGETGRPHCSDARCIRCYGANAAACTQPGCDWEHQDR